MVAIKRAVGLWKSLGPDSQTSYVRLGRLLEGGPGRGKTEILPAALLDASRSESAVDKRWILLTTVLSKALELSPSSSTPHGEPLISHVASVVSGGGVHLSKLMVAMLRILGNARQEEMLDFFDGLCPDEKGKDSREASREARRQRAEMAQLYMSPSSAMPVGTIMVDKADNDCVWRTLGFMVPPGTRHIRVARAPWRPEQRIDAVHVLLCEQCFESALNALDLSKNSFNKWRIPRPTDDIVLASRLSALANTSVDDHDIEEVRRHLVARVYDEEQNMKQIRGC